MIAMVYWSHGALAIVHTRMMWAWSVWVRSSCDLVILDVFILSFTESEPDLGGSIRLVNGTDQYEGRVEILVNGQWGTICDDFWSDTDASVVCRQLGFSAEGAIARNRAFFGRGTGPIILDNVQCNGTEVTIADCNSNPAYIHDCYHGEDAGVHCLRKLLLKTLLKSY